MARIRIEPELSAAVVFDHVSLSMPRSRRRGGQGTRQRLRRLAGESSRQQVPVFSDLSALILPGQSVALLGGGRSGREELLRLAAGTLVPDSGKVRRQGRVIPILDDSRCLTPSYTTRQNIYLTAGLLGMTPEETTERLDWIVDMAQAAKWLDSYLRGAPRNMRQRLVWTVSMATGARIFAVEKSLVIGHGEFMERCWSHVEGLRGDGVTFLVASDEREVLDRFCDRALVLRGGRVLADTTVAEGMELLRSTKRPGSTDQSDDRDDN
jgi:ABC-type polysaccharide/polyol phosphate transport system ATPase subunit